LIDARFSCISAVIEASGSPKVADATEDHNAPIIIVPATQPDFRAI
jgi:hypothetical protein